MTRRLLNLLTVASVLLCVAAGVAWARGYFHSDAWDYGRVAFQGTRMTTEAYDVHSARGGLSVAWGYGQSVFRSPAEADEVRGRMGPTDGCFRFRASELTWLQYAGGFYQQAGGRLYLGFAYRLRLPYPGRRRPARVAAGRAVARGGHPHRGPNRGTLRAGAVAPPPRPPDAGRPTVLGLRLRPPRHAEQMPGMRHSRRRGVESYCPLSDGALAFTVSRLEPLHTFGGPEKGCGDDDSILLMFAGHG
jgi:hypothetical protein